MPILTTENLADPVTAGVLVIRESGVGVASTDEVHTINISARDGATVVKEDEGIATIRKAGIIRQDEGNGRVRIIGLSVENTNDGRITLY
ncbi:MAG TPA: hypothetical protein VM238_16450 [Phycisphaerae bacterium]|nr:hypothetical protein [Phycisphaerae bacterium]